VKSFLFPGWGQSALGGRRRALAFAAAEVLFMGLAAAYGVKGHRSYERYRDARTPEDARRLRLQTERYDRRRNQALAAGGVVWMVNMVDILRAVRRVAARDPQPVQRSR
jgi:hypothetical protein